jgi:hypothetical protein
MLDRKSVNWSMGNVPGARDEINGFHWMLTSVDGFPNPSDD